MNRANIYFVIMLSFCFSRLSFADAPSLADANRLFDFAETAEPTLFYPPVATEQVNGAGSDWFYRYFSGSDSYAAININGVGPYFAGDVYVLGGQLGEGLLYVDALENLLAAIDSIALAPSGGENAITNPGNGVCVARKFPPKNDTATFRTTTFSGETSTVTERSEFYEEVTDSETITVIEQTISTGGSQTLTSNRYTTHFESLNGMLFESENDAVITTSTTGLSPSKQTVNTTYAPSRFIGPADFLCEGQEWIAAPVTQTTISNPDPTGNGPVVSLTRPAVGRVDSIDAVVTVRGVTYNTVKMTLSYADSRTIIWTDLNFGVRVMSESYQGDSETPFSVEELALFELPF